MSNKYNPVVFCAGCQDDFYIVELSDEGYCTSCQYTHEANNDNRTAEQFNEQV